MTQDKVARAPTPAESFVIDALARAMEPEAWADYDEGMGVCTIHAGGALTDSILYAKKLIRAWPGIVEMVNPQSLPYVEKEWEKEGFVRPKYTEEGLRLILDKLKMLLVKDDKEVKVWDAAAEECLWFHVEECQPKLNENQTVVVAEDILYRLGNRKIGKSLAARVQDFLSSREGGS